MSIVYETEKPRSLFDRLSERPGLWQEIVWTGLVCGGAAIILASLVIDHFGPSPLRYFGPKQIMGLVAGLMAIGAGVAVQIRAQPHKAAEILKFWGVAAQVGLLVYVVRFYNLENNAFYDFVAPLVLSGFIVHHYLPATWRMPFFLVLSLAAIYGVFGAASPATALGLIGIGLALFGVCHLPIPLWGRLALIAAITAALALVRLGYIEAAWVAAGLPVLASMFMFRLAVYLYDRHNNKGPNDIWSGLSYFFMLPNVVFPFFPVVDYTTFGRTHYNDESHYIYQRGAAMLLRGVVQLLLYRLVNYYLVLPPEEVVGTGTFVQFVIANYGLYLRISGLFHLIVGLLLLFGFNLPETHAKYLLANSFVDYWRRINIYWKDFMQKMVFTPSYMHVKGFGLSHAMAVVVAIFSVFFATWALHAYQWFWLRGSVDLGRVEDMLFWGILAAVLVVQTMREERPQSKADRAKAPSPLVTQGLLIVRTLCTFLTICLLWSLWTTETVQGWLQLWYASGLVPGIARGAEASGVDWIVTGATLVVVSLMAAIAAGFFIKSPPQARAARAPKPDEATRTKHFYLSALATVAVGVLLTQISILTAPFGAGVQDMAHTVRETRLNARDQALLERGYYQQLTNVNRMSSQLWEIYMNDKAATTSTQAGERKRDDFLGYELIPSSSFVANNAHYDTNRWGMRDQDYPLAKAPGTYRVALIGSSRAVGWGVGVEDRYETLIEKKLNRENTGGAIHGYDVMNFAVEGYLPVQELIALETKALRFTPDAVLYEAGPRDPLIDHVAEMFKNGVKAPYPFVDQILREAGVHREMSIEQITRLVWPHRFEIVGKAYEHIVSAAREHGAKPIWVYIPNIGANESRQKRDHHQMRILAEQAGFAIIDLYDVYDGKDPHALTVLKWDDHPNETGHRLIADKLYQPLVKALTKKDTLTRN
jgi:alginate O-acetyltransferase complex protein AlgI